MIIRYDSSQDITLTLTGEEDEALLKGPTDYFSDIHKSSQMIDPKIERYYILLREFSKDLLTYFFLGYSKDNNGMFRNAGILDGEFGKIIIPEDRGEPWMINLSKGGIDHFKRDWPYGIRYPGGSKLFICKNDMG